MRPSDIGTSLDVDLGMVSEGCFDDDFVIVGRGWDGGVVERDIDDGVFVNGDIVIYHHSLGMVNEDGARLFVCLGGIGHDDVVGFTKCVDGCLQVGG